MLIPLTAYTLKSKNEVVEGEMTCDQTFLAGMMVHELIHVNINRYIAGKIDASTLESNFPGLTDYIKRFDGSERTDHEYMAANSRGVIAQAMRETDIAQNTPVRDDKWYDAAAWNGLTHQDGIETETWTNFKKLQAQKMLNMLKKFSLQ